MFPKGRPNYVSEVLRFGGPAILAAALLLAAAAPSGAAGAPAAAEPGGVVATIDRPVFDRKTATIAVPFKGRVPNYSLSYLNNATRLNVDFLGCEPKTPTTYKLAVYHELLSQVELIDAQGKARVSILTSKPAKVSVEADLRHGVMRLTLEEVDTMEAARLGAVGKGPAAASTPTPAPFVVLNGPPPPVPARQAPTAPRATPGPLPSVGLDVLTPSPPPFAPNVMPSVMPSAPPIRKAGMTAEQPLAGTPASGIYVYRKAIPTGREDVTEVQVRTGTKAEVDIAHDPQRQSVLVNVVRPEAPPAAARTGWSAGEAIPSADEPWKLPSLRRDLTFKPLPAVNAVVGYTAMLAESAPTLGSDFSGNGATSWGVDGHVPLGSAFNMDLGVEGLAYNVTSPQVKDANGSDAQTRRDEYLGKVRLEYLAVRSPWVFAIGPGYWARYMMNKAGTLLPPPTPNLLLGPNQLFHGPAFHARIYYPLWDALALTADAGAAPYLITNADAVGSALGSVYGYDALLGLKWSNRYLSMSAGYHHQGFGSLSGVYTFNRGGPEVSFVWRF
jgi:hypothetical protein